MIHWDNRDSDTLFKTDAHCNNKIHILHGGNIRSATEYRVAKLILKIKSTNFSNNNTDNMQYQNQNISRTVAWRRDSDFGSISCRVLRTLTSKTREYAAMKLYSSGRIVVLSLGKWWGMIPWSRLTAVFILAGQRFRGSREGGTDRRKHSEGGICPRWHWVVPTEMRNWHWVKVKRVLIRKCERVSGQIMRSSFTASCFTDVGYSPTGMAWHHFTFKWKISWYDHEKSDLAQDINVVTSGQTDILFLTHKIEM